MLTAEKIQEIADGCEGVTKGPWVELFHHVDGEQIPSEIVMQNDDDIRICFPVSDNPAVSSHIARLDPATVRALCSLALDGLRMREEHARLTKLVAISDRRRIASTKAWMSAAEKALSGDVRDLRLIVDLANAPPVAVVLSEDKAND